MTSKKELEKLIDEEAEAAEQTRDEPLSDRAIRRGNSRSVVYSVRLTPDQTNEIQRIADEAGIPASTLVRDWVVQGLAAEKESSPVETLVEALSRDVDRLRRRLRGRKAS